MKERNEDVRYLDKQSRLNEPAFSQLRGVDRIRTFFQAGNTTEDPDFVYIKKTAKEYLAVIGG